MFHVVILPFVSRIEPLVFGVPRRKARSGCHRRGDVVELTGSHGALARLMGADRTKWDLGNYTKSSWSIPFLRSSAQGRADAFRERRIRERLDVGANDQLARAIWAPRKPALLGPFPSVGQSETIPLLYGRLKVEAAAERRIVLEPTRR